jgi:hypothetical protein
MIKSGRWNTAMSTMTIGLLLVAQLAIAQQSVIDTCRNSSSDADRIACLEAALLGKELVVKPESGPDPDPKPQSQIDPPSMRLDAGPANDAIEPASVGASTATATAAVVAEEPLSRSEIESQPVGIGAEQVIVRNQTHEERDKALEQSLGLAVASYHHVPYERLVVTFENGQVWRQIKGDTNRIRVNLDRNQTADIRESSLGGYKLRLNEIRRTIRVERIK